MDDDIGVRQQRMGMNKSQVESIQHAVDSLIKEEKEVIKGESLMVDITDVEKVTENERLAFQPVPDEIKQYLASIPDTDMLKVDEMRKKYLQTFDMTEEQYNKIAEEILEEGFVLT